MAMNVDSKNDYAPSPRVNYGRLAQFNGGLVRLPCKIKQASGDRLVVVTSDDKEVTVKLTSILAEEAQNNQLNPFVEVIGRVTGAATVSAMQIINMGEDLDMKLVNDTIELIHDPRFYAQIFSPTQTEGDHD